MADNLNLEKILFLDIETVPQFESYARLPGFDKDLWDYKALHLKKVDTDTAESLYPRAGIYAEFGRIICISVGFIKNENGIPVAYNFESLIDSPASSIESRMLRISIKSVRISARFAT